MSRNIRIVLTEPSEAIPDFYKDSDGLISFDLFEGTDVAITQQIDEATEIGSIRQDTVKNFEIPATNKNRALIGPLGNPQAFNVFHSVAYPVQILVGDYLLPERFARLVGMSDAGGFEIEVTGDLSGWIKPLTDLKLSDLDLGTFDFTEANVESLQEFDFEYLDGGSLINFPLVNYGAWPLGNKVAVEDFRVWFSALGILQETFCSIGWTFICPILETSFGRRLWCYLLKENFRESSVSLADKGFQAELTSDLDIKSAIGCVPFDDDFTAPNADPGGNYTPATGTYQAQVTADFFFTGQIEVVSAGSPGVIFSWFKIDQFGNTVTLKTQEFGYPNDGTFDVELSVANVNVASTDQICLQVIGVAFNTTTFNLKAGSKIWNVVRSATYSRGDTLILADLFNENYTALDFLKGIIHLFNLKPETDPILKTVSFYPETGAKDYFDEGDQEAFFFPNTKAKDWTDKLQCRSLVEDLSAKDLTNEYLLAFKETNDPGVQLLKLDLPLHSELITQTEGNFREGRTENRNPFFEPTRNDLDPTIAFPIATTPIPYIPFVWDSAPEEGEFLPTDQATSIGPRIILAYGYDSVGLSEEASGSPNPKFGQYQKDDGTIVNEYLLSGQVLIEGVDVIPSTGTADEMIVYGSRIRTDIEGNSFYLYTETIRTFYFAFPVEFLFLLTLNDLINFSNRDRIFFKYFSEIYGELTLYSRVVKITDFLINRELTTPVQLLPRVNFFDIDC